MRSRPLITLAALACPLPSQATLKVGEHTFHRTTLQNGLAVLAVRDDGPQASIFMVVSAGKRHETPETTGLAHLTEHAMYAGTARTKLGQHDRRIKAMGGESNAFTREDYTLFYDHGFPVGQLPAVLAMEADRLRGLTFDEQAVLYERRRLEEEEARTYEPTHGRRELLESKVFTVHGYGAGLLTDKGHTKAPGLEVPVIKAFYDRFYHPDHTAVVVVSALPPEEVFAMVDKAFGALPRGPERAALPVEPLVERRRVVELPSDLTRQRTTLAWVVPALGDPDRPALDAVAKVVSRRTTPDGTPVEADMGTRVDRDLFQLSVTGPDAGDAVRKELRRMHAEPFAAAEVEAVKKLLAATYAELPLRARPYFSLAGTMGVFAVLGHPTYPAGYADAVAALTPERLSAAVRRHLPADRCVEVTFRAAGTAPKPLPVHPHELQQAASAAREAGDLDRAIRAYTRLLEMRPDRMFQVIYLAERGQTKLQMKDYDGAIADYEAALKVVDYPAVRVLLKEARELKTGKGKGKDKGQGDGDKGKDPPGSGR